MLRTEYVRPVHELLAGHAADRGDRVAFADDVRSVTYAELSATTARLAGHLQRLGLGRGEKALLYLDNRVEVAESYLAVPRAGAVAVCVNPGSAPDEVAHVLDDSAARVVVTDAAHLPAVRGLLAAGREPAAVLVVDPVPDGSSGGTEQSYAALLDTPAPPPRDCLGLDDTAWMLYTSGTTGRPKGVYLTPRGCLWVVAACLAPIAGLGPDDVLLSPLPLFHSYALVLCVLGVAAVGATGRILVRFSVDDVRERLAGGPEGPPTVFPGVPTMFSTSSTGCPRWTLRRCVRASRRARSCPPR